MALGRQLPGGPEGGDCPLCARRPARRAAETRRHDRICLGGRGLRGPGTCRGRAPLAARFRALLVRLHAFPGGQRPGSGEGVRRRLRRQARRHLAPRPDAPAHREAGHLHQSEERAARGAAGARERHGRPRSGGRRSRRRPHRAEVGSRYPQIRSLSAPVEPWRSGFVGQPRPTTRRNAVRREQGGAAAVEGRVPWRASVPILRGPTRPEAAYACSPARERWPS
mmetsp:Transcript_51098/g.141521  ORF Transcript_51098/g.141521 Transcript_51098/m.141521 type:complete len:224 (-) Transcript_51098:80-751(-)